MVAIVLNNHRTFIIAEAGVNHNGNLHIAKDMIDVAKSCGADAIKFQTFKTEKSISKHAKKAEYQKVSTDVSAHRELIDYCKLKGIEFLSTPFDLDSINMLNDLGLKTFKIPSGEITNLPYLRKIGSLGRKIIISTGMSTLGEVNVALNILTGSGTRKENIVVMHCNTEYPTPFEDVNLNALLTMKQELGLRRIGYSDHTVGIELPIAAIAMGATVIEKHFTLDKKMEGPDHKASLDAAELKAMVLAIRNIEKAFGDGIKKPSASELKNILVVRKSIVAAVNIKKGDVFSDNNIGAKRPGNGISPMEWDNVVGKTAKKDFKEDELIEI